MASNGSGLEQHVDEVIIDLRDDESVHSDFTLPDEAVWIDYFPILPVNLTRPNRAENSQDLRSCQHNGVTLQVDQTVELDNGDFLLIKNIAQCLITQETFLEGHIFQRTWKLEGLLEKKKNEVVWIQQYNPNKEGDISRQSVQRVELKQVVTLRDLILTNHVYPTGSYRDDILSTRLGIAEILKSCRLACRWKYLAYGDKEGALLALDQDDVDEWYQVTNSSLKHNWRGSSVVGGSCEDWIPGEKTFDKAERSRCGNIDPFAFRQPRDPLDGSGKRYTFGDGFCGAGGVSRGAKAAGLRVHWSFDFSEEAIKSYRMNFFETMCWNCSVDIFIMVILDDLKVDILHLSLPCQPFSPAHTRPGQNDDGNEASFFALEGALRKTKPRVVMVEEAFGLLRTADRMQWFRAMIQVFTKMGFSVRWKIFNLIGYGLPGRRQRLFVYASCPGEPLPSFPLPTHGSAAERNDKPYPAQHRTINDAINLILTNDSMPNDSKPCNEPAYDGDVPLPNTICCGQNSGKHPSSQMIHPSGKRTFTSRELASLNGFPLEHEFGKFGKTELRKQIGNAVPPVVAKIFLEQIVKSLQRADGL